MSFIFQLLVFVISMTVSIESVQLPIYKDVIRGVTLYASAHMLLYLSNAEKRGRQIFDFFAKFILVLCAISVFLAWLKCTFFMSVWTCDGLWDFCWVGSVG